MPRRILIIVNPDAGRVGSHRRHLDRVVAALQRRGCTVVVRDAGPVPGAAEHLARTAEPEFDVIVAAGGDGTIAAVVNGIAESPRPIAVLPLGTANVLAAEIGLPRRAADRAAVIATGPAQPIWPGRIGGRLFVTSASSGFDADIVATVDARLKRRGGRLAFVWASLVCLWHYRERQLTVRANGAEHHAAAVIATTGPLYAGRFVIAPEAILAEPVLHLVLLRGGGRFAVLRYMAALWLGRLPRAAGVTILSTHAATIAGGDDGPVQADGDIVACLPVTLEIAPHPIPLIQAERAKV